MNEERAQVPSRAEVTPQVRLRPIGVLARGQAM